MLPPEVFTSIVQLVNDGSCCTSGTRRGMPIPVCHARHDSIPYHILHVGDQDTEFNGNKEKIAKLKGRHGQGRGPSGYNGSRIVGAQLVDYGSQGLALQERRYDHERTCKE